MATIIFHLTNGSSMEIETDQTMDSICAEIAKSKIIRVGQTGINTSYVMHFEQVEKDL